MSPSRSLCSIAFLTACAGCTGALGPTRDASTTVKVEIGSPTAVEIKPTALPRDEVEAEPSATPEQDVARISADAREVTRYLTEKRRAQDTIRVLCLNDKLSQLHAAERAAGQHRQGMREATASHDEDQALHERSRLGVLRRRADRLVEESRSCI